MLEQEILLIHEVMVMMIVKADGSYRYSSALEG
jgi:hypothetical protein